VTGQNSNIRAHAQAGDWGDHADINIFANDMATVRDMLNKMQPGKTEAAANAYNAVASRMDQTVELLYKQAQRLVENWGGDDAEAAMKQMQKAYDQAYEIHDKSNTTGTALSGYAEKQRGWQDSVNGVGGSLLSNGFVHAVSPGAAFAGNDAADHIMEAVQNGTVESNNQFPGSIRADMPGTDRTPYNPNEPRNPAGPGPGVPNSPGGGVGAGGPSHVGGAGAGSLPTGGGGAGGLPGGDGGTGMHDGVVGTDLAGLPPGGGGGTGAGGLGGGLGSGGLGGGGLGGGLGAGGAGAGGLGAAGAGGLGAGVGPGAGAMGRGGAGAGRGGAAGANGMPMGAGRGGGSGDEEEHERSTWLAEDEDVWTGGDDVAPPVIG
jgi:hypothetical protein